MRRRNFTFARACDRGTKVERIFLSGLLVSGSLKLSYVVTSDAVCAATMSIEQRGSSRDFQRFVSSTGTTTLPAPSHRVQPIRLGHRFQKKTFRKRTFCHHCTDMLWGIVNQGYQCLSEKTPRISTRRHFVCISN